MSDMHRSVLFLVRTVYRDNPPEMAQDDSPAAEMDRQIRLLSERWLGRLEGLAPRLAGWFTKSSARRSDRAMARALDQAGFTVRMTDTARFQDVLDAATMENVGLIRSIAQDYLGDVHGMVMRSVQRGRDLGPLTKEIEARFGLTRKRAALIARDQNNKATAVITQVRQIEAGITEAIWVHSTGGKVPRPSHVKAGREKLRYDVRKGALIDGEWIFPGQMINCRCVSRAVIPGLEDE
jgi:uncharacterized protein with gpF-like domain